MNDQNVIPAGIVVGNKPANIETLAVKGYKRTTRWSDIARTLNFIDKTKTIRVDIAAGDKKKVYYMRKQIRDAAKKMGITKDVRFATDGTIMHVWIN